MWRERIFRAASIAVVGLALNGCSSDGFTLFATGTGIAAGAGVDHTVSGTAYRTFAASKTDLRIATLWALQRMELEVVKDGPGKNAHAIVARAKRQTIEIELEALSGHTSLMRVTANESTTDFHDTAAATEIIVHTAASLDDLAQRHQAAFQPEG